MLGHSTMPIIPLPDDSRLYAEMAFREKEKLHQHRARMSFTRKIKMLDELFLMQKELEKLRN
jgi:hypothetical protein